MPKQASRGAGSSPRHGFFACLLFVALALPARAMPFLPDRDTEILETLPDAGDAQARALRAKHQALAADPHHLSLALDVARGDLDRSRALGDPRYLGRAQSALAPWSGADAPPEVKLLRAVILQSNHDFAGALALLAQIIRAHPDTPQAWLTRAAIHQAQADYAASIADCGQFARMIIGLAPDICTASAMSLTGHAPLALHAVAISLQTNAAEAARQPAVAMWGLTLAAETAERLDDPGAQDWFSRALALDERDPYLLGAWSDYLLDHDRPREVARLLARFTRIDPLLLRLALAEQALHDNALPGHIADLAARFEASRLRGDTVHRREEARFQLALMKQPARALELARANWEVQREPADARILFECALAAHTPQAADPALAWLRDNHVQDNALASRASKLHDAQAGAR